MGMLGTRKRHSNLRLKTRKKKKKRVISLQNARPRHFMIQPIHPGFLQAVLPTSAETLKTSPIYTLTSRHTNMKRTLRLQSLLLRLSRFWAEPAPEVVSPRSESSSSRTPPEPLSETSRAQSERTTSCAWWSLSVRPEDCVKLVFSSSSSSSVHLALCWAVRHVPLAPSVIMS